MDKHFAFSLFCFYYRDRICQLSSSHAFKVLKDIQAVDQTISKYSDLRFSWCRISLSCKLMSIFMALKSIYISYNFHQDYPGFGFTKKIVSFLLIARLIVEHDDLMHARYDRWQIKIRISRNPTNWATNTASIVIACMSKCKASWHPHIYCY